MKKIYHRKELRSIIRPVLIVLCVLGVICFIIVMSVSQRNETERSKYTDKTPEGNYMTIDLTQPLPEKYTVVNLKNGGLFIYDNTLENKTQGYIVLDGQQTFVNADNITWEEMLEFAEAAKATD